MKTKTIEECATNCERNLAVAIKALMAMHELLAQGDWSNERGMEIVCEALRDQSKP